MGFLLIKVGKDQSNDFCINRPKVENQHLELFVDVEGNTYLTDLETEYGTFVNGKKIEGSVALQKGDIVNIAGEIEFDWEKTVDFVGKNSFDIGSDSKNKIRILHHTDIDPFHLQIFKDLKGNIFIKDLESLNGTFINGYRIQDIALIKLNDQLRLGKTEFEWQELFRSGRFPEIKKMPQKQVQPTVNQPQAEKFINSSDNMATKNKPDVKSAQNKKEISWKKVGIIFTIDLFLFIWFRMLI